jgi:hypothetical protein
LSTTALQTSFIIHYPPKDDRKKDADAIEFCELGDGVSAIFTKKSNTGFADLGRTQT